MQERLRVSRSIEVAALLPENDVLDEDGSRRDMLAKLFILPPEQHEKPVNKTQHEERHQRGEEPADTTRIKLGKTEITGLHALVQDPADQIAADHEENVHTGESSGQPLRERVVNDDAENRHSTETVNIRSVSQ